MQNHGPLGWWLRLFGLLFHLLLGHTRLLLSLGRPLAPFVPVSIRILDEMHRGTRLTLSVPKGRKRNP